jgi:hypothetical protein
VGVGVGLRRPLLADVGSIQIKSNVAVSAAQVFFSNIGFSRHTARVGRDPRKEAGGKAPEKGYETATIQWSACNMGVEDIDPRCLASSANILLLDFFPESAMIWNIWENKLALVKGKRAGSVVATER